MSHSEPKCTEGARFALEESGNGDFTMLLPNSLLEVGGFARETTKMVAHVLRDAFMSGQHEAF